MDLSFFALIVLEASFPMFIIQEGYFQRPLQLVDESALHSMHRLNMRNLFKKIEKNIHPTLIESTL